MPEQWSKRNKKSSQGLGECDEQFRKFGCNKLLCNTMYGCDECYR